MSRLLKYLLSFISSVVVLLLGFVVYLIWFQPAFYFPKPTGTYTVGTKTYHWIDTNRKETLGDDPAHPNRELMVKIWYPSSLKLRRTSPSEDASPEKPTTPYAPYLVDYFKKYKKLAWFFGLSRPLYSFSQPKASLISGEPRFPVILFSPGSGGTYDSKTAACEELASHGYVVVSASHTYDSFVVQFPDGRIVYNKKEPENISFIERRKITDQYLEVRISDMRFILDQLEELTNDKNSIFYQRLEVKNSGIFGQSMGGAVAAQLCRRDSRIKAGVNLDGSLFGPDFAQGFNKPFMFMAAGESVKMFERPMTQSDWKTFGITSLTEEKMVRERYLDGYQQLAQAIGHDTYIFVLNHAGHLDFTDSALFKHALPISRFLISLGLSDKLFGRLGLGSIDGMRVTEIVNAYLVDFFNTYLKRHPSAILNSKDFLYHEVYKIKNLYDLRKKL